MADNRKYYYLKLKENFFDSDSIVLLEDMKDGILYSNILLKPVSYTHLDVYKRQSAPTAFAIWVARLRALPRRSKISHAPK